MGDVRKCLRALAHPGAVLALVVLALNDHVLKQAWPGFVTGKLSDIAGLVVFPLLLAVVVAMVGIPHPLPAALVLTGAGFATVKALTKERPSPAQCGAWGSPPRCARTQRTC